MSVVEKNSYLCIITFFEMKRILLILLLFASTAQAQYVRLTNYKNPTALYLDLNRIYNYNLYERNQFGIGFYLVNPSDRLDCLQWNISAYVGYSTLPKELKYGATVALQTPTNLRLKPFVQFVDDFEHAGSSNLEQYDLLSPAQNASYMSSRYARIRRGAIGASLTIPSTTPTNVIFDVRYTRESLRFDSQGYLYPNIYPEDYRGFTDFAEMHLRVTFLKHFTFDALGGIADPNGTHIRGFRAILQYRNTKRLSKSELYLFSQAGYVTPNAPYTRRFDLSGTAGSYFYFNDAFLTLARNSVITDFYFRIHARWTCDPLIKLDFCRPAPFAQLGAIVAKTHDGTWNAFAEPALGVDGIIRWGVLDLGVALAYRLSPHNDPSYTTELKDKMAVMFSAKLIL